MNALLGHLPHENKMFSFNHFEQVPSIARNIETKDWQWKYILDGTVTSDFMADKQRSK